jgi:hypothetical protein
MTTFKQARMFGVPAPFTAQRFQYGVTGRPKLRAVTIRRRRSAGRSEPILPRTILLTLKGGVYTSALAVGVSSGEEVDAVGSALAAFLSGGGKFATIGEQWAVRVIDHG